MLPTIHNSTLKTKIATAILKPLCIERLTGSCKLTTAFTAATVHKLHAVALAERSAAFAPFQRFTPTFPPTQNADSAPRSITSAAQSSGNIAINAANVITTATFLTFRGSSITV